MKLAIDTNRYRDVAAGDPAAVDRVARAEATFVPFVVLGELRAGFALGSRSRENEKFLRRFLAKATVDTLWPTEDTTRIYADLRRQLRKQGTPIAHNDIWIAALTIEHRLALFTRDSDFRHLRQLDIV